MLLKTILISHSCAQRIKNVLGRTTDVADAEWITKLLLHGLIEKSFASPAVIRELWNLTRLRKKWIGNITAEKNHIQMMLECSNIKLGSVTFGVSEFQDENFSLDSLIKFRWTHRCAGNPHLKLIPKAKQISDSLFGILNTHAMCLFINLGITPFS